MKIYAFVSLISICFFNYAYAVELQGTLSLESETVYEGYPYLVYSMEVSGEPLSITIDASEFLDSFLILHLPDESFSKIPTRYRYSRGNDNYPFAEFKSSNPAPGKWTFIVTSYYINDSGAFKLAIEGAKNIKQVHVTQLDKKLVEDAFAFRGVYSKAKLLEKEKEERLRRIELLSEQLSLASFRSQLITNLTNCIDDENDHYLLQIKQLKDLKKIEKDIEQAKIDIDHTELSTNLLYDLLDRESKATFKKIQNLHSLTSRSYSKAVECHVARGKIEQLDGLSNQLDYARNALFELESNRHGDFKKLKKDVIRFHQEQDRITHELARKIIDSSLDTYLQPTKNKGIGLHCRLQETNSVQCRRCGTYKPGTYSPSISVPSPFFNAALLPWPPPPASSDIELDKVLPNWRQRFKKLGDVDQLILEAAWATGYHGLRYFRVPGGFASIAQLEQTDSNGVPLDGKARWSIEPIEMKRFSISEYIKALLTAPEGYYRVIAFIASSDPFSYSDKEALFTDIRYWGSSGFNTLPEEVRSLPYSQHHKTTVLVYEFFKKSPSAEPTIFFPGEHTTWEHLERTNLLSYLK